MIVMFCVARVSFVISEFWGCFFLFLRQLLLTKAYFLQSTSFHWWHCSTCESLFHQILAWCRGELFELVN